jgi:tRNA modification GTPase
LFNRLVRDQSAIVSSVSGTTRDFLQGTTTIAGVEVEVIDTAGWNPDAESHQAIDRQAAEGRSSVETLADIRLYCVPVGTPAPVDLNVPHPSFLIRTLADLQNNPDDGRFDAAVSVKGDPGIQQLLDLLERNLLALRTGVKAAMSGRCLTSLMQACDSLDATLEHARQGASMEIMALGIRETLSPLGEIVGAVYTNDLLDRIFSRFCIGK